MGGRAGGHGSGLCESTCGSARLRTKFSKICFRIILRFGSRAFYYLPITQSHIIIRIMIEITILKPECKRCKHSWIPRSQVLPKICPKCKSKFWGSDRKTLTDQEVDLFVERLTAIAGHNLTTKQVSERTQLGWSTIKTALGLRQIIQERPGTVVYTFNEKKERGYYLIIGQNNRP